MKICNLGISCPIDERASPIIQRLNQIHEKNQKKELQAQQANHQIVLHYQNFKKNYSIKAELKDHDVMGRLQQLQKRKVELYKKQSMHVEKIMENIRKDENHRSSLNRNLEAHNSQYCHSEGHSPKKQTISNNQTQKLTHTQIVHQFFKTKFQEQTRFCDEIIKRSKEKQEKAYENRKAMQSTGDIKEINDIKIFHRIKAERESVDRHQIMIRKSVEKNQKVQKRQKQNCFSQSERVKKLRESGKKNLEEVRKRKQGLEEKFMEKLDIIERNSLSKQTKISENKQNILTSTSNTKKSKRLKRMDLTCQKFTQKKQEFNQRMQQIYKQDRQDWGFVTGINQLKTNLIQKNMYQNTKISLLK